MKTENPVRRGLPPRLAEGIAELDRHQRRALVAEGNLVIIAGPGSGKTRTVVARAGYLLSTRISPLRGLAAITYTNQAATELREGLARLGVVEPQRLFAGTLHSFCLTQVLRYARLVGVDLPGLDALMDLGEVKRLQQECADETGANIWALRDVFPSLRRRLAAGEDVNDHRDQHVRAVKLYEAKCEWLEIWDFEGIVLAAVRLLRDYPQVAGVVRAKFPAVVVDEYQDLGAALHRLVETLLDAGVEITAVGDIDQSIFGFAGGDPEYLNALCDRDDVLVRRLVTNYRCGSAVVAAAELALAQERGWRADPGRADPGVLEFQITEGDAQKQAFLAAKAVQDLLEAGVAPHEIAILLRYRPPLAPLIEQHLTAAGVAARLEGTSTVPSTEVGKWLEAAALYAIRMTPGAHDNTPPSIGADALMDRLDGLERLAGRARSSMSRVPRVAALHKALIGETPNPRVSVQTWSQRVIESLGLAELAADIGDPRTSDELEALAYAPDELLLTDLASDTTGTGKVVVSTYHGAKGRTFAAVVLPGLTEGVVPPWGQRYGNPVPLTGANLEEERRNFYVALTRSRGSVLLQLSSSGMDTRRRAISRGYSSFAVQLATSLGRPIEST